MPGRHGERCARRDGNTDDQHLKSGPLPVSRNTRGCISAPRHTRAVGLVIPALLAMTPPTHPPIYSGNAQPRTPQKRPGLTHPARPRGMRQANNCSGSVRGVGSAPRERFRACPKAHVSDWPGPECNEDSWLKTSATRSRRPAAIWARCGTPGICHEPPLPSLGCIHPPACQPCTAHLLPP